jgi:uncharacterized protein (TIGR03435 family)
VPSKNGHKLAAHTGSGEYSMRVQSADDGRLRLRSVKGSEYDFTLQWAPNLNDGATCPSLFTALSEQLGLTLQPAKNPVQAIVIDRIERPSEN